MIDIVKSERLSAIIRDLRRGRLPSLAVSEFLVNAGDDVSAESVDRAVNLSRQLFSQRIISGSKIKGEFLESFRLIDSGAAGQYEIDMASRSTAKSTADRVAAHIARRSDIGELPKIQSQERKSACKSNLAEFGQTYCSCLLKHAPSARMMPFIEKMQEAILFGGQIHVRWPRGKGKSTWIKIAILWACSYGHRRYAVAFSANSRAAGQILGDIWRVMECSELFFADFPEIAHPVRCLNGITQRCVTQCHNGHRTLISRTRDQIRLPTIEGSISSGALIGCRGVEAGSRGLVDMDQRPDFLFFDDIQTKKSAASKSKTDWLEEFVQNDAMCMAGHDLRIAALMATTPIKPNDLSERFADAESHPEWITFSTPLVVRWPSNMDLVEEFGVQYRRDMANRDLGLSMSRAFYVERREEIEAGSEMLDPLDGDPQTEVSSLHHALNLYFYIGREGFMAEYQMQTRRQQEIFSLDVDTVTHALNSYARCMLPRECKAAVAFVDVNASAEAGLRWTVLGIGPGRVCAVLAYGRYPDRGRLYPEKATTIQQRQAVALGMMQVITRLSALPLRRQDGRPVRLEAACFDCGWQTATVASTIKTVRAPFKVIMAKGQGWKHYKPYKAGGDVRDGVVGTVGDHCHLAESEYGHFLTIHTDYWREEAQRSFLAPPLSPGSCSLYGSDPAEHYDFAVEVCNEHLSDKATGANGTEIWTWTKSGANHWGDTLSGAFAVGSWFRLLDATETIIEREIIGQQHGASASRGVARQRSGVASISGNKNRALVRAPRFRLVRK